MDTSIIMDKGKMIYILLLSTIKRLIEIATLLVNEQNAEKNRVKCQESLTILQVLDQKLNDYDISYIEIKVLLQQALIVQKQLNTNSDKELLDDFINELIFCIKELEKYEIDVANECLAKYENDIPKSYIYTILGSEVSKNKFNSKFHKDIDLDKRMQKFYNCFAMEFAFEGMKKLYPNKEDLYDDLSDYMAI
jgi:HD superfamily phosphohydrolase